MMSNRGVFNLIDDPWLPARRRSGAVERIAPWGIVDRIDEDPFVAIAWPRPDFDGAAHEFLIGLLSTAAAPDDDDHWEDWWERPPTPEQLQERFASVASAFDLDGPGSRFMQDLDPLEGVGAWDVEMLLIDAPAAKTRSNNADLFVRRGGVSVFGRAAAAMALYTLNAYAPTGGQGHRTSLRGGGPMTTLVVARHKVHGATLWGRVWPNVETARRTGQHSGDGLERIFPWLASTRTSNPKAGGRPTVPGDVDPLQVYWGMPRRIRLSFEDANGRSCDLTGNDDFVVVANYRTKNYGTDYTEGFEHPLTPYYREKADAAKRPVHAKPGSITYRSWPGLVVRSTDGLRYPAQVVRHCRKRWHNWIETRIVVFGYDMKQQKARAWIQGEMPIWLLENTARESIEDFIHMVAKGAGRVGSLLARAVKSALYERPSDAKGDYGFMVERFDRETEGTFFSALKEAVESTRRSPDAADPTIRARENWMSEAAAAARRLFDEHAPAERLEHRDMHRHVKARFCLDLALNGRGKEGRLLFEDLVIVSPERARKRKEAA